MRRCENFLKITGILILVVSLTACSTDITKVETIQSEEASQLAQEVNLLIGQFKFNEAIKLLDEKYDEGIRDIDVLQQYAYLEYHLFEEFEKAVEIAKEAITLDSKKSSNHILLGDIYFESGKYEEAIKSYNKAIDFNNEKNTWDYELSIAHYSLGNCYLKVGNKSLAIKSLEASRNANPYNINSNRQLHRIYVEEEEYSKAYEVWKDDNFIMDGKEPLLERTKGFNDLYGDTLINNTTNHEKLGDLYVELLLYDEAISEYEKVLLENSTNQEVVDKLNDISIFITFRDELKDYFDNYYRERCIDGKNVELYAYKNARPIYEKIAILFPDIEESTNSKYWIKQINNSIEEKFKARIEYINANGAYFGCNFGYIFDDFSIQVSQWGDEGDLRLIVLKNMESNGVSSWLTKGQSGVGGWSLGTDEIVSILKGDGYIYFMEFLDLKEREIVLKEAEKFDGALSEKGSLDLFYSKALEYNFSFNNLDNLNLSAEESGYSNGKTNSYIFNMFIENFINTTIIAHESQHALDAKYYGKETWLGEYEYRAKMSELAYGNMQFATLNQLYEPSIGSDIEDTHSRANTQIFKDIVQYIYDNSGKFPNMDTSKNILMQLTELEDGDIREIAIKIFESKYPDKKYK